MQVVLAAALAVAGQLVLGVKRLGAALAHVVPLVVVHAPFVPPQQLRAMEGLGAELARVGLCLGMFQFVLPHVRASHKALAAELALCGLDLGVRGLMGLQVRFLHEVPSTDVTAKPLDP